MRPALPLLLLASTLAGADEIHSSGVNLADLNPAGSARMEGRALRLTGSARHLAGAAWLTDRQPVGNGFQTEFQFRLTGQGGIGGGADGFAFVLQNSGPSALGGSGSGGGFALGDDTRGGAIPQSIAVFFDTFRNADIGDASNNFVTICTAGTPKQLQWPPARLASSRSSA